MSLTIGLDLGTTSITALALDTDTGNVVVQHTLPHDALVTAPADRAKGRSEWDAQATVRLACQALAHVADRLGTRQLQVAGMALTGQQHGVLLLDERNRPLTPFINWQDRRGDEPIPGTVRSWAQQAALLVGPEAPQRTGCTLATGFMGVTLYWMKETGALPKNATACFLADYVASVLTGKPPVTDPTHAASSGLLDIVAREWDHESLTALGLPTHLLPEIREAGSYLGGLTPAMAPHIGFAAGTPVFVGLGDHQAGFVGSVAQREESVLVNVGTGAQVALWLDRPIHAPPLEARPFPKEGYLLVHAGLSGGRAYAILHDFFRQVGVALFGIEPSEPLYERMNALAMAAPPGSDGMRCDPYFAGTRAEPSRRGGWIGITPENLTPAHLTRSLLEGMARDFRKGYENILRVGIQARSLLVGAGNALRANPALIRIVSREFSLPLRLPVHREEAAFGAALVAAVGTGLFSDLTSAGRLIRYTSEQ